MRTGCFFLYKGYIVSLVHSAKTNHVENVKCVTEQVQLDCPSETDTLQINFPRDREGYGESETM